MIKPLWTLAAVALLGTAGAAGAVIVASSGGEEEVVQQVETATSTATPGATVTAGASPVPDTPTPTSSEDYTQAALPGDYEISYPASWHQELIADSPYIAKYFLTPPEKSGEESLADLEVFVYENPQQLSLEDFFNGQERPNLFKDAAGGYEPFSAGGAAGYRFENVLGFTNYTVVALTAGDFVYQFQDPQKHQSDGTFAQIVNSFKQSET